MVYQFLYRQGSKKSEPVRMRNGFKIKPTYGPSFNPQISEKQDSISTATEISNYAVKLTWFVSQTHKPSSNHQYWMLKNDMRVRKCNVALPSLQRNTGSFFYPIFSSHQAACPLFLTLSQAVRVNSFSLSWHTLKM